jgi:hypothetical protein
VKFNQKGRIVKKINGNVSVGTIGRLTTPLSRNVYAISVIMEKEWRFVDKYKTFESIRKKWNALYL